MAKNLLVCLLVVLFFGCWSTSSQLRLQNLSNEQIVLANVKVCQQELEWKNVAPGGAEVRNFSATGDSHYEVSVELSSGKQLKASLGYVTNGMRFQDELQVGPTEIRLVGPTQGK